MEVLRTIEDLAGHGGARIIPTMGALHEGHLALVRAAAAAEDAPCLVTIFVNPTQFDEASDFERYPRDLEADLEQAAAAGATLAFCPDPGTVYPPGETIPVPPLPAVATEPGLEDRFRPGHFEGVCQVVSRLFDLLRPRAAVFGEKDYQQLLVIRAMAAAEPDRWPGLTVESVPTVREPDGLAMSSRNRLLPEKDRGRARGLFRALQLAHAAQHPDTAEATMRETLEAHDLAVEYAAVRDPETLLPVGSFERPTRALIAARLEDVRLIDNAPMRVWR